jgi:hypothetical protein
MKRWLTWVALPIALGAAAGLLTTLLTDRAWKSQLPLRAVTFSVVYLSIRPAMYFRDRLKGRSSDPKKQ